MKNFEKEIIGELLQSTEIKDFVVSNSNGLVEYSGSGYFLSLKDPKLPTNRVVLDKPKINGTLGSIEVGYLAFIENKELVLECYSYGEEVTQKHREQGFVRSVT